MAVAALGSIRVLHVDDEPEFSDLSATFIERQNERFTVETASSASEGLDRLRQADFDCVVSDFDMPGQNGIEFLKAVRHDFPELPFILFTGKGSEEVASDAISAGVTDYIQKESGTSQYEVLTNRLENVVEQYRAQEIAEETEHRLQTLAENSNDILWKFTADWSELLFINTPYEEIWGRSIDELRERPQSFLDGIHPDDRAEVREAMDQLSAGESVDIEYRVNAQENFGRWVWVQGEPVLNEAGEVEKVVGFARDITERKAHEQETTRLNQLHETVLSNIRETVLVTDDDGQFTYICPNVHFIFGYDAQEVANLGTIEALCREHLIDPEVLEAEGEVTNIETTITDNNGNGHTVLVTVRQVDIEDGTWLYSIRDITERKRHERKREQIIERVTDAIVEVDADWQFTLVNEQAEELYDMAEESLLGRDFWEVFEEGKGTRFEEEYRHVMETREPTSFTEYFSQLDGWFDIKVYPRGEGGLAFYFVEVTEQKEREQRYNAIFNQTYQFTGLLEPDGTLVEANQTALEFGGVERDDVIGKKMWDAYWFQHSEETRERARNAVERAATGEFVRHELPVQGADAEEVIIDFSVRPITDEQGNVTLLIPEGRDITELKEHQRELESKSRRLEAILENTTTPLFMKADNGEYLFVNRGYRELFDLVDEDIVGRTDHDIHPPDMADEVMENDQLVIENGKTVETEERIIVDGDERIFLTTKVPIYDIGERSDPDNPVAMFGVASDVTELKDRERQLTRYETLVEVSGDQMYMLDDEGRFTYVNEALVEMSGHAKESLIGKPVRHIMDTEDIERGDKLIRSLLTSDERRGTFEMDLVTADGNRIPTENHISLLYEDGEFKGTVGVLRNITDRLERERQLQRERDRLDEFAGIVSHDLRNPLNVAEGRLDLAMQDCESEHLGSVAQALDRMEALIDDVLTLARAGETVGEMETVKLADHVEACWQNVESASTTLVADTETTFQADKTRLQQLFENLLRNAVEHGGEDVTITVGDLPDGFYVEDDGPGISEEDRGSILDAGYSTAEEGTGFGLSIVRDIAEAHDWEIHITEADNGGARFEIRGVETE